MHCNLALFPSTKAIFRMIYFFLCLTSNRRNANNIGLVQKILPNCNISNKILIKYWIFQNFARIAIFLYHYIASIFYRRWSNEGVERLGREILRLFRATLSKMRQPSSEWPALVPILQRSLNNSPSPQRKILAPITIFIGHQPTSPVSIYKQPSTSTIKTFSETIQERFANLSDIKNCLEEIHPIVEQTFAEVRDRSRKQQLKGKPANFETGDLVLVPREEFYPGENLNL